MSPEPVLVVTTCKTYLCYSSLIFNLSHAAYALSDTADTSLVKVSEVFWNVSVIEVRKKILQASDKFIGRVVLF
jgi:hypothetical protein